MESDAQAGWRQRPGPIPEPRVARTPVRKRPTVERLRDEGSLPSTARGGCGYPGPCPVAVVGGALLWKQVDVAKPERDVEQIYDTGEVVAKLRRLADALETGSSFRIQIAGERIRVPARAVFSVEHERGEDEEEVEFQLKWPLADEADDAEVETLV